MAYSSSFPFHLPNLLSKLRKKPETPFNTFEFGVNLNKYDELQFLSAHTNIVRILLKLDENSFASVSDNIIIIWNYVDGSLRHVLKDQHKKSITCIDKICPENGLHENTILLISASFDNFICIWNTVTGQCLRTLQQHNCAVRCMTILKNSDILIAAGQNIGVWGADFKFHCAYERLDILGEISHILHVNSCFLICAIEERLEAYVLSDLQSFPGMMTMILFRKLPTVHRDVIKVLKISSEYELTFISGSLDGLIVVWCAHTLSIKIKLNSHRFYVGRDKVYPYSIQDIECQEDLVLAAVGNGFAIFDIDSGKTCIHVKQKSLCKVMRASFMDEHNIITCSEDGIIRIWSLLYTFSELMIIQEGEQLTLDIQPSIPCICQKIIYNVSLESQGVGVYLIAECAGHSGSVEMLQLFEDSGFVSCGTDNLVIIWKKSEVEGAKRTKNIKTLCEKQT